MDCSATNTFLVFFVVLLIVIIICCLSYRYSLQPTTETQRETLPLVDHLGNPVNIGTLAPIELWTTRVMSKPSGSDVIKVESAVSSMNDCLLDCRLLDDCKAFAYNPTTQQCTLANSSDSSIFSSGTTTYIPPTGSDNDTTKPTYNTILGHLKLVNERASDNYINSVGSTLEDCISHAEEYNSSVSYLVGDSCTVKSPVVFQFSIDDTSAENTMIIKQGDMDDYIVVQGTTDESFALLCDETLNTQQLLSSICEIDSRCVSFSLHEGKGCMYASKSIPVTTSEEKTSLIGKKK